MCVIIFIIKIDLRTRSLCLRHYVQNCLPYSGKETKLTLCINNAKLRSGVKDLRQNKWQLLHRITSVKTPQIYNNLTKLTPFAGTSYSLDFSPSYSRWNGFERCHQFSKILISFSFQLFKF